MNLVWSMKEAVLKSIGKGLHMDTRMVEVDPPRGLTFEQMQKSGWKPVKVHSPAINQPIYAWWQLRYDYILTLAAIPGTQKKTVPKIKEINLPPD